MTIHKRGNNSFQANFMLAGKRYRETFKSEGEAKAWEAQARSDHALGRAVRPPTKVGTSATVRTIKDLVRHTDRRHWAHKKSGASLARNAYLFAEWVGQNVPATEALNEDLIEDYLQYRETELRNSGSTVNRHRSAISRIAGEAVRLGILDRKPYVVERKEGKARMKVFTEEEELLILETVRFWGYDDHADLFTFLCDTGCRLGETEQLKWEDIQGDLLVIPGEITKSGEGRVIALTGRAQEAVARQKAKGLKGPWQWHNRDMTRTLWKRLRGHLDFMDEHCVLHTYRHTCASRLVQEQGYLDPVQRWLGHKNPMTTQRYAKYAPKNMQDLASLLEARQARENRVTE